MDAERLAEIKARCSAATPGPWTGVPDLVAEVERLDAEVERLTALVKLGRDAARAARVNLFVNGDEVTVCSACGQFGGGPFERDAHADGCAFERFLAETDPARVREVP